MWFSQTQLVRAPQVVEGGICIFAVGNIHGYAQELRAIDALVLQTAMQNSAPRKVLVYLGDYVDRGPEIRQTTIELLMAQRERRDGLERVFLAGNHDQFDVELIQPGHNLDRSFVTRWLDNGDEATLKQLGVEGYGRLMDSGDVQELSRRLVRALEDEASEFFRSLQSMHTDGRYVFEHAGIAPEKSFDDQEFSDLLMMREPFLSTRRWNHPFSVVHGHSIAMPSVLPHRIGVDVGFYRHGALCAVQIERDQLRFLGVSRPPAVRVAQRSERKYPSVRLELPCNDLIFDVVKGWPDQPRYHSQAATMTKMTPTRSHALPLGRSFPQRHNCPAARSRNKGPRNERMSFASKGGIA